MIEIKRFGDFASFKYGKMPNKEKITDTGMYPVYSGYRYVGYYDEFNTEANQLIVVARGVGGTGDVKLTKERCYLTNLSISADIDESIALPEYLYYYYLPRNLSYLDSGSAQSQITISDLEKVRIPLPSVDEQEAICGYLRMIDRKIELNEKINDNLSEQMSAIVSFYKEESSWNNHKLDSILEFYDYKRKPLSSKQRTNMQRLYPYYGATTIVDYVDSFLFEGTYILISEDGANVVDAQGHPLIQYTHGKFWLNNHAHIVKGCNGFSEALIYAIMLTLNLQSIVTGAAQPKINQANLRNFETPLPEISEAQKLSELVSPLLEQMIVNDQENMYLSQIRDTLLPKLISGEMNVSDLDI